MDLPHMVALVARQLDLPGNSSTQQVGSHRDQGSSVSALVSTLVPSLAVAGVLFVVFVLLRRRLQRLYQPRTFGDVLNSDERLATRHETLFGWVSDITSIHDDKILELQSIDSYLYVRFLKMVIVISFVGCCIIWPVLFPVNITGGGGQSGLDLLNFANIDGSARYFAHAAVAWVFLGFVMFVITKETLFFINLRQAYLLSPWNASRISARTVLFTSVSDDYLDLQRLKRLFPAYKQIWIATEPEELNDQVEERDGLVLSLEQAEISLSKNANGKRLKAEKESNKNKGGQEKQASDHNGVVASGFLDQGDRPTHRLKKFRLPIGEKVDTIDWTRSQLVESMRKVSNLQHAHINGESTRDPAALVEFADLQSAAAAYSMINHHLPGHIVPRQLGVLPEEILWDNLHLKYWQASVRYILATAVVCLLILFWSIPVALVGIISNVSYLADNVFFLEWLNDVPSSILGVITGLLPAVLLALLMVLVPVLMRKLAVMGGAVTTSEAEIHAQNWYFWFEFIQVFLLTTFTSGATSVATQIVNDPTSAVTLLAQNLPKASNFYIAYFVLQGLTMSSRYLVNVMGLIKTVIGHFRTKSPRQRFNRLMQLPSKDWGSIYPKFANLAVIAISYSCIAPLVLGFSTLGMTLIYFAFRYNILFVYEPDIDTKGASYALALQHLVSGIYLSELCLIGLFAIRLGDSPLSTGPLVMMIVLLVCTFLWHISVRRAFHPLTHLLPRNLLIETCESYEDAEVSSAARKDFVRGEENSTSPIHDVALRQGEFPHQNGRSRMKKGITVGKSNDNNTTSNNSSSHTAPSKINNVFLRTPPSNQDSHPASRLSRMAAFFQPSKHSVANLSARLGSSLRGPVEPYSQDIAHEAYFHPAVKARTPILWLVKDKMGVSEKECRELREQVPGLQVSDEGAKFDAEGKIVLDLSGQKGLRDAPIWEGRVKY